MYTALLKRYSISLGIHICKAEIRTLSEFRGKKTDGFEPETYNSKVYHAMRGNLCTVCSQQFGPNLESIARQLKIQYREHRIVP
jgi:hypothetical protein